MMKIIFSDLDGTLLLKGENHLNKNIKNSIYKILESGNAFAVASGRTYIELKDYFKEFEEDIFFICNDGSLAIFKEQTLMSRPMDKSMFADFKEYTAHGKYVTYIKTANSKLVRSAMEHYRSHVVRIDSITDISEEIYKISDFDKTIPCPLPVVYKDSLMNEFVAKDCDKKEAVSHIAKLLNVKTEDTFAFGDNTNDLGMFDFCGTSYAAIGAKPAIKKSADKISKNIEKDFLEIIKND